MYVRTYIHTYIYTHIYVYIYTERERGTHTHTHLTIELIDRTIKIVCEYMYEMLNLFGISTSS